MGSGAETARETAAYLNARGERVGVLQVRLYRPFPAAGAARRAAAPASARSPCSTARRSPAPRGEPLFLDVVAALTEAHLDGELGVLPRVIGGRYGLSSKEFTPGMVAGVFAELARERPRSRFTVGINDDVSGTSLPYDAGAGHRAGRHRPRGVLRARLGRHGRREQEHHQDPRRRSGHARAGLLRLRLEEVRLADGVAPAVRARADPGAVPRQPGELRRLPPVRRCSIASTCSAWPRPARRCCSTLRTRPDRVWDALPRPVQEQILAKRHRRVRDRRRPGRARGRPAGAYQHRAADLLLRHLRRAAARRGDRRGSRRRSTRPTAGAARTSSPATTPRSTATLAALHRIDGARARDGHPRATAGGARARAASSCRRSPR